MAPVHESMMDLAAGSPIAVMMLMVAVAVVVLAGLTLAALMCACGEKKKEEAPTALDNQPLPQLPPAESLEQRAEPVPIEQPPSIDEAKSAKTACERTSLSSVSTAVVNAPALSLSSQKGPINARVSRPTPKDPEEPFGECASLKLTGMSLKSETARSSSSENDVSVDSTTVVVSSKPKSISVGSQRSVQSVSLVAVA